MRAVVVLMAVCMCVFLSPTAGQAQEEVDVVYLVDGSKIVGTITEMVPNERLTIRTTDGRTLMYSWDQIERVQKERARVTDRTPEDKADTLVQERPVYIVQDLEEVSYIEAGATVGMPAFVNGLVGYWGPQIGFSLGGMAWGNSVTGLQANVGYRISDNTTRSHRVSAVAGGNYVDGDEWLYLGVVYNLYYRGLYVEAGPIIGTGPGQELPLAFQVGYTYRFLPDRVR